ncbi:hypothetical protein [Azospirillum sp. Sh1]|uniref:hypothetical protein n=1 Tax=Azospirillum sp. Sh1 TaxID=2607285 RepID=UPI0011EFD8C4|nr:hypothetical protein [Azospirillum sp. Sh1]KAA0571090.1 hypothetical protein FZ029_27950 [Azospirillum sp. Sh1]
MRSDEARFAAFCLMEMSGLPVGQMWAAMAPYLSRRQARRRPTWSAVHERLTDLILCSVEAPEHQDPQTVLLIFQGGMACRALTL